jgi:hypothetical protein
MVVLGGGALPSRDAADDGASFEQNAGVARWLVGPEAPEALRAFAFYLLTAAPTSPEVYAAWYADPDRPNRAVDMVRGALLAATKSLRPKALSHYILLPPGTGDPTLWAMAGQIAARSSGAVGFSLADAKLAERVTLLAPADAVDERAAAELERSGCRVERIEPDLDVVRMPE